MGSIETSEYRKRRKLNLIKICGNKCALCGYDKIPSALEFHHIKPEEKSYGIAANGTCHNLEADLAEVKKCILVCANCHREIEYGLYSQKELFAKQVFIENEANLLREEKKPKQYFCKECGVQIYGEGKTGLCPSCASKARRVVERPSREVLKTLIRTKPFTQIGNMFRVSDNTIRKWCDAENLPRKSTEIKKYSNTEWEKI